MSTATTEQPPGPPLRTRRIRALTLWAVGFVAWSFLLGLPATDPILAFGWLWLLTIAWRVGQPWKVHLGFARDWAPVAGLLLVYNLSRGFADNGAVPHAYELIYFDKWMFGGHVPTLWLQERFYDPDRLFWWDVVASWVYFSHFVVAFAIAVVLWLRDRRRWAKFVRRWFALCLAGLITYFLYPAAPPWWAGKFGLLPEVARISTRGWRAIGLHGAGNVLNAGQIASNPVAAMPSLHTAFALLAVAFFLDRVRKRWWPVLALYPLAMTATLVYCGEHYIIDVLVGWVYVGFVFLVVGLAERWWSARRRRAEPTSAQEEPDPVPAGPLAGDI